MKIKLKRGYEVEIQMPKNNVGGEIDILGSYSKCGFSQTSIVNPEGIAQTITGNHGEVMAILEIEEE